MGNGGMVLDFSSVGCGLAFLVFVNGDIFQDTRAPLSGISSSLRNLEDNGTSDGRKELIVTSINDDDLQNTQAPLIDISSSQHCLEDGDTSDGNNITSIVWS